MAPPEVSLSLYVHVPFCADKCLYCDFYSVPRQSVAAEAQGQVMERTIAQIHKFGDAAGKPPRAQTVFVGGGTPSVLQAAHLEALFEALQGTGCAEWTVEANPESLDDTFLGLCRSAGVTRLSVGIQTLRDDKLRLLRRPATRKQTLAALDLLGRAWDGEVNFDFIAGVPGQSAAEVREDLSDLVRRRPGHFSLYQLTREEGTLLDRLVRQGRLTLNTPETDEELWFAGSDFLAEAGYRHYEVSNFALPGKECRHNLRYWNMEPYLGAGPGAVSTLPGPRVARALERPDLAASPVVRMTNPRRLSASEPEIEIIEGPAFLLENVMMGLRLAEGIPAGQLKARFGRGFQELFPGLWERWTAEGWAEPAGERQRLTERGMLILDTLLEDVAEQVPRDEGSLPFVVRWP